MDVFVLALTAAFNPTLLAATTVMLLMPKPRNLMLGYLLGAMMTSVTLGLAIVFTLEDSGAVDVAQNTLSPAVNLALGFIALAIASVLRGERDAALRERMGRRKATKAKPKPEKGPPRWQRALNKGSARTTFAIGAMLTLPGASYLAGLNRIAGEDPSVQGAVLAVFGFNLIMLGLIEVPLLSYWLAPDTTPERVQRARAALGRNGRHIAIRVATVVGALLVLRGAIELIA
jgi:hypothetical protein